MFEDGTMERHEVRAWFGDTISDFSEDEFERFYREVACKSRDESEWLSGLERILSEN